MSHDANSTLVWFNGSGANAECFYRVVADVAPDKFAFKRNGPPMHICRDCGRENQRSIALARHRRLKHG